MKQFFHIEERLDDCPIHGKTLFISVGKNSEFLCSSCNDEKVAARDRARSEAIPKKVEGLPSSMDACVFQNFEEETEKQANLKSFCENFCEKKNTKLLAVFSGDIGSGKSHLASACLHMLGGIYLTEFGISVDWSSADNWNGDYSTQNKLRMKWTKCQLLVIDEIGRDDRRINDFSLEIIRNIVLERYENNLKTILVTNYRSAEVSKVFGRAIISRLQERGVFLSFEGIADYRQKKARRAENLIL